jgi:ABC-2 type transport system permease protein
MAVTERTAAPGPHGASLARLEAMPRGLPKLLSETYVLYVRAIKRLSRQATVIFFSLIQPLIWLVLFGQMFSNIVRFPGAAEDFGNVSYLQFFIPTVILQSILFGSGQSGVGMITDIDSGFLDKLLTTPINRLAILLGRLSGDMTRMVVQMLLVIVIGWVFGQFQDPQITFYYGFAGILGALGVAMLFALALMAFNIYIALWTRSTEATFIVSNFLTLPLLFTSSAQLPIELLPEWMQKIALVNPVTYTIEAMRVLLNGPASAHNGNAALTVFQAVAILVVLNVIALWFATRRFRSAVA